MPAITDAGLAGPRIALAVLLTVALAWWTIRRAQGAASDPQMAKSIESDTGALSVSVSGVYLVAGLALAILAIVAVPIGGTALIPIEPLVVVLALLVGYHWAIERGERT
jgi:hypothetical protein